MPRFKRRRNVTLGFGRRMTGGKRFSAKAKDSGASSGKGKSPFTPVTAGKKPRSAPSEFDWGSQQENPMNKVLAEARSRGFKPLSIGDAMRQMNWSREKALETFVEIFLFQGAEEEMAKKQAQDAMKKQYDSK